MRGIQAGKAYFTDEDGVTRVASEPILAELVTGSYFWRRAYLFEDLEGARLAVGPADENTVSVSLAPRGGNPLLLTFSRSGIRLLSARSTGFAVAFSSPKRFRDSSRPEAPLDAEIRSIGLPADSMEDALVGGWSALWKSPFAEASLERLGGAVIFRGRISGREAQIALDASADGPLRVRPGLAETLGLAFQADVLGRRVARGGTLQIAGLLFPSLSIQQSKTVPTGADAAVGAALFRETVVELDPAAGYLRFHDPARWVAPEGFYRDVLDDDGDRPVAILKRRSRTLRLLAGTDSPVAVLLAPGAAARLGISQPGAPVEGLRWGAARLSALPVGVEPRPLDPEWEDGRIGFELLLRAHVFLDMPHRWVYLKPRA